MMNELISCMEDTLEKSYNGKLKEKTECAIKSNCIYKEGFVSNVQYRNEAADIEVYSGTTFEIAKNYRNFGRIAVLNFANPEYSGGGVWDGAMAQEECLCRSSNLYVCISNENVFDEYYAYHRDLKNYFYSDRLIYTKDVTVFKSEDTEFPWLDDDIIPQLMPEHEWFQVDVITCAAPYIAQRKYTNSAALLALFKGRIKNIFEAARDNQVDVIVLGAWGCGAFKNPPKIVAKAFHEVINENNYTSCFKKIVFAIKSTASYDRFAWGSSYCPNIAAFEEEFYGSSIKQNEINIVNSRDMDKIYRLTVDEDLLIGDIVELKVYHDIIEIEEKNHQVNKGFYSEYAGTSIYSLKDELSLFGQSDVERIIKKIKPEKRRKYLSKIENIVKKKAYKTWVESNVYYGKQFSVLGDSISTLDGYNPRGYNVFYSGENSEKFGVVNMQDTWWDKVISYFGGELLINNSWSGSRVTRLPNRVELFPSGCSDERTSSLHINEVKPDVIIVYLGTNDWAFGVQPNMEPHILHERKEDIFDLAYDNILKNLKKNYPNSEIWCCTLCTTYISGQTQFVFPYSYGGTHIEVYNNVIREVVQKNSCKLIDLYAYKLPYDTIDGSHPSQSGMSLLASMVVRSIIGDDVAYIIDCSNNTHDYFVAEESIGSTKYVCRDCCKVKYENTLCDRKTIKDNYIGKQVEDRYKILVLLKQESVFKSYLAIDEKCNRQYEMKICDKYHESYSDVLRNNILQEADMWRKLNHPYIQKVFDILEDENNIYIISEYMEGESFDVVLRDNGPIEEEMTINLAKEICAAIGYLHKQNPPYIYREIKPANIMLRPGGSIKLINFDMSKVFYGNTITMLGRNEWIMPTLGYTAPEGDHGKSSDIYSLGVTLHQLVTGVNPCKPPYVMEPIRAINPNLSSELEAIIIKCTQIYPEARYQSCDELLVALQGGIPNPSPKNKLLDILFGRRGGKTIVNRKVKKIYNSTDKEQRDKLFYGGEWSAESILIGLARDVFGEISDANIELCFQIYLQTWIRARGGLELRFSTPSYIRQTLCERFCDVNPYIVSKCVTYSLCEIYRHEPELKKRIENIENCSI